MKVAVSLDEREQDAVVKLAESFPEMANIADKIRVARMDPFSSDPWIPSEGDLAAFPDSPFPEVREALYTVLKVTEEVVVIGSGNPFPSAFSDTMETWRELGMTHAGSLLEYKDVPRSSGTS
jgi:hypothetical protein